VENHLALGQLEFVPALLELEECPSSLMEALWTQLWTEGEPAHWVIDQRVPSSAHLRWFLLQALQKREVEIQQAQQDLVRFDLALVALFL